MNTLSCGGNEQGGDKRDEYKNIKIQMKTYLEALSLL